MFASQHNPLKAYQTAGIDTEVSTASPHKLIVMLFDGALQAISLARIGIGEKDIPKKGMAISKAIDIVLNGLRISLNREEGGKLAEDLYALYDYIGRRLLQANVANDIGALNEVEHLLSEIRSAWIEIGETPQPPAAGE